MQPPDDSTRWVPPCIVPMPPQISANSVKESPPSSAPVEVQVGGAFQQLLNPSAQQYAGMLMGTADPELRDMFGNVMAYVAAAFGF